MMLLMGTIGYILSSVLMVSLLSFVGALTVSVSQERLRRILFIFVALAVGALWGDAVFHLLPEAHEEISDPLLVSVLLLGGMLSFFLIEKILHWHHHMSLEHMREESQSTETPRHIGRLILIADGFHNFIDGLIIGTSYLVGVEMGIATTIAVLLHEVPQEIGDFGVLLHVGYKRSTALFYNFLSALPAFGGAIIALVPWFPHEEFLPYTLPFAAGVFLYIANADLVPELQKNKKIQHIFLELLTISVGIALMYSLLFLE